MEETSEELPNFSIGIVLLRPDPRAAAKISRIQKNPQVVRFANLLEDHLQQILTERHSLGTEKTAIGH